MTLLMIAGFTCISLAYICSPVCFVVRLDRFIYGIDAALWPAKRAVARICYSAVYDLDSSFDCELQCLLNKFTGIIETDTQS
jgi:hypothetical protein